MKDRIESATKDGTHSDLSSFGDTARAFASSLAIQLLLCNWCIENWRRYINFLEESLREATGRASIKIYKVPDPAPSGDFQATLSRRTFSSRALTDNTPMQAPMFPPSPPFAPLQASQPPQELHPLPSSKVESEKFERGINGLTIDLHMQKTRAKMLLRLLEDGKNLVFPYNMVFRLRAQFHKADALSSTASWNTKTSKLVNYSQLASGTPPPHGSHDARYASDRAKDEARDSIDANHRSRDPLLSTRQVHLHISFHLLIPLFTSTRPILSSSLLIPHLYATYLLIFSPHPRPVFPHANDSNKQSCPHI
jgi:hypothetical protein